MFSYLIVDFRRCIWCVISHAFARMTKSAFFIFQNHVIVKAAKWSIHIFFSSLKISDHPGRLHHQTGSSRRAMRHSWDRTWWRMVFGATPRWRRETDVKVGIEQGGPGASKPTFLRDEFFRAWLAETAWLKRECSRWLLGTVYKIMFKIFLFLLYFQRKVVLQNPGRLVESCLLGITSGNTTKLIAQLAEIISWLFIF